MATTINSYSTQLQAFVTDNTVTNPPVNSRLHSIFFSKTFASQASGEDVALCIIPKGSRIVGGYLAADGALANSAQVSVGLMGKDLSGNIDDATEAGAKPDSTAVTIGTPVADSVTCLKAAAVQSTTKVGFALTLALGLGYVAKKDLYLTITTSVGTVAVELLYGQIDLIGP